MPKIGVALNSWETAYFKETAFYVNGTFDKIKKDLSIIMTDYIIKKTQKDWREIENEEMNNEKFASEEEFKDYWKRTDTLEDYGVIVQKVSEELDEIYDIKRWKLVYLLQVYENYTNSFLRYHNLIDLSSVHFNISPEDEEYKPIRLNPAYITFLNLHLNYALSV